MNPTRLIATAALLAVNALPALAQKKPPVVPRPEAGTPKPFVFPAFSTITLPNGLRVAVVENHEMPLVTVRMAFDAGTFVDAPGKEGGWWTMLASLPLGTTTRSQEAIGNAVSDLGAVFTTANPPNSSTMGFIAPRSSWTASLELLGDMVMNPAFPQAPVQQLQGRLATVLAAPAQVALRHLYAQTYGPSHAYGRYAGDSSVRAVTRDDLVRLQKAWLGPQNTVVVITGDVTVPEARAALLKVFGPWAPSLEKVPAIPAPPLREKPTTVYLRHQAGGAQSFMVATIPVRSRNDPDAIAVEALGAVMGGPSAGSRMFEAFRTRRSLAYSPLFNYTPRPVPEPGAFTASASVPVGSTATAVTSLINVLREVSGDSPVTAQELEFARGFLIGSLPLQMETIDAVADRVLRILHGRLPDSYLNDQVRRLERVTLPDIQAAARKYLPPERLAIVVVGDLTLIEPLLKDAGILYEIVR